MVAKRPSTGGAQGLLPRAPSLKSTPPEGWLAAQTTIREQIYHQMMKSSGVFKSQELQMYCN